MIIPNVFSFSVIKLYLICFVYLVKMINTMRCTDSQSSFPLIPINTIMCIVIDVFRRPLGLFPTIHPPTTTTSVCF